MRLGYKVFYFDHSYIYTHTYIKSCLYRMMMSHLIMTLHEILFADALLKWLFKTSFKNVIIDKNIKIYS